MSPAANRHDAGMLAVARVRGVREQDSRIGLQQALAEQRSHEQRVAELRGRLQSGSHFESGPAGAFLMLRASLDALGANVRSAERDLATGVAISEAAYEVWQADRARLAAVESLIERRAAVRRAEAARREARELDEIAVQRWQRRETERGNA
ncbi:MAG TPA: flagellar export protein FliJ [Marmoricola sp.]|nr:flagellar export protein FliJ [Marmoricola sp.]